MLVVEHDESKVRTSVGFDTLADVSPSSTLVSNGRTRRMSGSRDVDGRFGFEGGFVDTLDKSSVRKESETPSSSNEIMGPV